MFVECLEQCLAHRTAQLSFASSLLWMKFGFLPETNASNLKVRIFSSIKVSLEQVILIFMCFLIRNLVTDKARHSWGSPPE